MYHYFCQALKVMSTIWTIAWLVDIYFNRFQVRSGTCHRTRDR